MTLRGNLPNSRKKGTRLLSLNICQISEMTDTAKRAPIIYLAGGRLNLPIMNITDTASDTANGSAQIYVSSIEKFLL
jgi:hypothetical protein